MMGGVLQQRFTTVLLLLLLCTTVEAWHKCSSESSDICPTGNACCFHPPTDSYRCLSSKNPILGQCCADTAPGRTGCGDGFQCAETNGREEERLLYCARIDPDNDLLPTRIPRYQLCSLAPQALQEVYGLTMIKTSRIYNQKEDENDDNASRHHHQQSSPQPAITAAAYLSNMGSFDTEDPIVRQAQS